MQNIGWRKNIVIFTYCPRLKMMICQNQPTTAQVAQIDHSNDHHRKVPTLQEIARKVAGLEKNQLDEQQYISYEMIACTFLLGIVKDGHDSNTTLFTSLQKKPWR